MTTILICQQPKTEAAKKGTHELQNKNREKDARETKNKQQQQK